MMALVKRSESIYFEDDHVEISNYCVDRTEQNFANIIGCIEDTLISENFLKIQAKFMETYWKEFSDDEENKLIYTDIFHKYLITVEVYIENELVKCVPTFCMAEFEKEVQLRSNELDPGIREILCTFWDFEKFKSMFLEYKKVKEGRSIDFSPDIVITKCGIINE
ncbi:ADP-ribosylation factor-like protein 2-binding protein [Cylas formicarius]|uniref:ADP-ribosylation factor-like protein 2-binding protein n=1 Tax=Cylas formicarius TaxID=197179 RepID=UPI002958B96A|nr:ADP-ribosylation factor-like protein 2-binding protein [Cylas formicarius]